MKPTLATLVATLSILFLAPSLRAQEAPLTATLTVHADQPGAIINKNIFGQFSEHLGHCIYGGIWVGPDSPIPNTRGIRNDVVQALRDLKVPVLRWPGGCFADEYHWKDGIGPREKRPRMINTHWGGVVEDNSFGTHEFLDLCEQVGCEPYITGNLGSGSPQEMMEWVEYMTSDADSPMANLRRQNGRKDPWKVKYFAVGNESWGCGGSMRPEFYGDNYRRYNTFLKNYGDNKLWRVACGPNGSDHDWTDKVMGVAAKQMNGLALHYYTITGGAWTKKGSATEFGETEWIQTFVQTRKMEDLIAGHSAIMDKYDPKKKIGLVVDEWGTWYNVEKGTNPGFLYQQNTLRDALVAAVNFNIFQQHADRVVMANIAQMVNVLQAMILTDGPRMVLTPTYHAFEMYKVHQDGTFLPTDVTSSQYAASGYAVPAVSASASRGKDGKLHLSLVNLDPNRSASVTCTVSGSTVGAPSGRVLTAPQMQAHNTFEAPGAVTPTGFTDFSVAGSVLTLRLPAKSLVVLDL